MTTFQDLGLSAPTLAALESKGFASPTPIQERTIPLLLAGSIDILGQARTGTGKTAAFALPIIEVARENCGHVQALVLAPTRELAIQVAEEINSLKGDKRLRVLPVYGGQDIRQQFAALKRGVDVVVGTPGRIMDHLSRGTLRLDQLDFVVLDEADEMCNMGFVDDVREILMSAKQERRTLLFSATMPRAVMRIATEFMGDFKTVKVEDEPADTPLIRHIFHEMDNADRFEALCRVIDAQPEFYGLIFTRTRADADEVALRLNDRGYPAEPIHGDISQPRREEILNHFRNRKATILVATDVAARGIDVPDLTHVVNFALPQDPATFVHRTGRTGRAGKEGMAVTLISPGEFRKLMFITRSVGIKIDKEQLPRIRDVIYSKKRRLIDKLEAIMEEKPFDAYASMARDLVAEKDPVEVVAALLRYSFGDELMESSYREIDPVARQGNGRADMVCALGRAHGMTPRHFVDFVCEAARIKPFSIQHVRVQGNRTTFTLPQSDVERVIQRVNDRDGKPLISKGQPFKKKPPFRRDFKKSGPPKRGGKPFKKPYKPNKD
ncbi:DEAD/DEAH box helicase [Pseudodesulfovibrio sp.]|uniref:DEAD/DEAH box helicase n=1 Tax=unclassified Pseudodesulfovibrio TaxID=2661612 RepID=UPI003B00BEFD